MKFLDRAAAAAGRELTPLERSVFKNIHKGLYREPEAPHRVDGYSQACYIASEYSLEEELGGSDQAGKIVTEIIKNIRIFLSTSEKGPNGLKNVIKTEGQGSWESVEVETLEEFRKLIIFDKPEKKE